MSLTYEAIKSANERVERIEIKRTDKRSGKTTVKNYACVPARVQAFREMIPDGCIMTEYEVVNDAKGVMVICKATVTDRTGQILATGLAYEREGSNQINGTSFLENAETSAVGRALGFIGIGSESSMASAEEMANALYQQTEIEKENESNLVDAHWVDENGEHGYQEECDRILKDIVSICAQFGKSEADTYAYLESKAGKPVTELSLEQLRRAKVLFIGELEKRKQ